ncbi:MAG: bacteriohopanetetrol glucosamine biosynthesis glycosyltransferase HpnI [Verrucomicrobia bacterium]|nr:bacteriohopanetetrol glucosamine biosynthesis glycosyltransferase HpnI [Verrucomicrobiota bacterium]
MEFSLLHGSLILLTALSALLTLWQWLAAFEFPLHRREKNTSFSPPVTLLKPLKGADAETKACLRGWLEQDYAGAVQVLFGVASPQDPVCEIVRELIAEFPKSDAQLVLCEEQLGPNAKVSTLIHLERLAKHELVIVSDADVRVPNDYLANAIQPLADPKVGLVNSFYKFANPSTYPMHWEAVAVNADFWSQVLQSQKLKPIDFALGAAMIIRRETLNATGGFERLVHYLADDYQLGNGIAKAGKQIVISPIVVECWEAPKNFSQIWQHQLRWARTIRVCQPVPFFFSILGNATIWPFLWTIYLALKTGGDLKVMFLPVLIFWPIRMFIALNLQEKLTGSLLHYRYFWLIPIKDLLGFAIWLLSFFGNKVEWRGQTFRVQRGGELEP